MPMVSALKPTLKSIPTRQALSIAAFCTDNSISRSTLYELWARGEGPRKMSVGRKVLISADAAADWRREREAAAQVVAA